MNGIFSRRSLLSAAAGLIASGHSLAASQYGRENQASVENSLLETYGGIINYDRRFPIISRTGPTSAVYLNRIFPPEELKHLDSIAARLVIHNSNNWDIIYESTVNFEKIRGYIVRKEFNSVQNDITTSLFLANIERSTKRVIL